MKRFFVLMLAAVMMVCLVACTKDKPLNTDNDSQLTTVSSEESTNETKQTFSVFNTENITRIALITRSGEGEKIEVPDENMAEMTAWLASFEIDKKIQNDELILPGTNTIYVEIEYADGIVINSGLDTTMVDGVSYYTKSDPYPDCYYNLLDIPQFN